MPGPSPAVRLPGPAPEYPHIHGEAGHGARALRNCAIGCVRFCSSRPPCQVLGDPCINSAQQQVQRRGRTAAARYDRSQPLLAAEVVRLSCAPVVRIEDQPEGPERIRAMSVPERAENCGRQRSATGTANSFRSGHGLVNPLRETYFSAAARGSKAAGHQRARARSEPRLDRRTANLR